MTIRIVTTVLILVFAVFAGRDVRPVEASHPPDPNPNATPITVVKVTETAVVPQTSLQTRTVEATPVVTVTPTETVPSSKKEEIKSVVPNPRTSFRAGSELNEVSGAHLTVYNCIGDNGGYCFGSKHTATGADLVPGTAACDQKYLRRKFVVAGDPTNTVWTCLDTGLFSSPLFDLWFNDLKVGLGYLKTLPSPYKIVFVD